MTGPGKRKRKQELTHDKSHHQDQKKSKLNSSSDASSSAASSSDASSSDASSSAASSSDASSSAASSSDASSSDASSSDAMSDGTGSQPYTKERIKELIKEIRQNLEPGGVSSQIIPTFDKKSQNLTIDRVEIIGRPKNVFGNSMGDHTTAFAVQKEGIKQQLKGKTIPEAFNVIQKFYDAAMKLPGFKRRDNLTEDGNNKHKERLDEAQETLKNLLDNKDKLSSDLSFSELQKAVGAYLEFRELIPLSTINVSLKYASSAGKGKGESSKVKTLVQHQKKEWEFNENIKQAIMGLFDSSSAAIAIVEPDKEIQSRMLPGLNNKASLQQDPILNNKELTQKKKINNIRDKRIEQFKAHMDDIIIQHLSSIDQAFPNVFNIKNIEGVKAELEKVLKFQMKKELNKSADQLTTTIEALEEQYRKERQDKITEYHDKILEGKKPRKKLFEDSLQKIENEYNQKIQKLKNEKKLIDVLLENKFFNNDVTSDTEMEEDTDDTEMEEDTDDTEMEEDTDDTEMEEDTDDTEMEEDQKAREPLAMQIFVDSKGIITTIKSEGRTPPPFTNSKMGAHTTAWIVHIDQIRKALNEKTPEEAIKIVKELVEKAKELKDKRQKVFNEPDVNRVHDENLLINAKKELDEFTSSLEKELDEFTSSLTKEPDNEDLINSKKSFQHLKLQEYLVKLLTYINYIPGVTINKSDTGGKGEAEYRGNLIGFEYGDDELKKKLKPLLKDAIKGLLDIKGLPRNQKKQLYEDHKEIIKKTYPEAYKAASLGNYEAEFVNGNGKKRSRNS